MKHLIAAEFLKLRSTRTSLALIGSVVGLIVLISLLATFTSDPDTEDFGAKDLLGISGFAQAFALVLGILAVTTEFRHGTITPTLIAAPNKTRLVLAKLVATVAAGLLLGLLAVGLCAAIVLLGLSVARHRDRHRRRTRSRGSSSARRSRPGCGRRSASGSARSSAIRSVPSSAR